LVDVLGQFKHLPSQLQVRNIFLLNTHTIQCFNDILQIKRSQPVQTASQSVHHLASAATSPNKNYACSCPAFLGLELKLELFYKPSSCSTGSN